MELNTGITALWIELWKRDDSTHTHRHTRVHLTRAHAQPTHRPLLLHYPEGALSAPLFAKTCSEGCIQDPFPYSQGFRGKDVGQHWVRGTGHAYVERATHAPSPVFSTSWTGVSSRHYTALGGALSLLPQSSLTPLSAGCLREADFHVRTQSELPARHGPCSKAGKTLQNPRRAPLAHLHLAGASGWVGSGRDPHLNLSCYSACEY